MLHGVRQADVSYFTVAPGATVVPLVVPPFALGVVLAREVLSSVVLSLVVVVGAVVFAVVLVVAWVVGWVVA